MGVRIVGDYKMSCMYCSTTDWAFGPVFNDYEGHDAGERLDAFLRWLVADPRIFTDKALHRKYNEWLFQEDAQWQAEALALKLKEDYEAQD